MGVAEGETHAADNHKVLNNTAYTVANFRTSGMSIVQPQETAPAFAGPNTSPNKIAVKVAYVSGVAKGEFTVTIGGLAATISTMYEVSGEYTMEVNPPVQPANGTYTITVSARGKTASQANAVVYGDTNNADIMLVLDHSGSMYGEKLDAAKAAASQFVDYMRTGDKIGVASFSTTAEVNYNLTEILSSGTPVTPWFEDDMESGSSRWSTDSPWALTTENYYSSSHSFTDSPGGSYANSTDVSLTTASVVSIPGSATNPSLSFWQKYEIENGYDHGYVEVSNNGGSTWTEIISVTGTLDWEQKILDLASYTGQDILIRFRLDTDSSVVKDGWYIDDVKVENDSSAKVSAKNAISQIVSDNMTSIGGGLQTGYDQLTSRGVVDHPWAIVLLSDGQENTSPMVADVLPAIVSSKAVVHTIGLGSDADEVILQDIATQTGGTYSFAPSPGQLSEIYNTIVGNVTNQQMLYHSSGTAQTGVVDQKSVTVDSSIADATFSVTWTSSSSLISLRLVTPGGAIIDSSTSDPNVEYVAGSTYAYYRVSTPTLVPGVWTMEITGGSFSSDGKDSLTMLDGEPYVVQVLASTSLTMNFELDNSTYNTEDTVKMLATLSDTAAILGANVVVTVQAPSSADAAVRALEWIPGPHGDLIHDPQEVADVYSQAEPDTAIQVTLYDDGRHGDYASKDGIYANYYSGITIAGVASFKAVANGVSNTSSTFTRQSEETAVFVGKPQHPAPIGRGKIVDLAPVL